MFNKKKLKIGFRIIFVIGLLFVLVVTTPFTLSKYQNNASSSSDIETAIYLLEEDYYTASINLIDLVPRTAPYVYTFSVANYNSEKRCDTNLTYDLSLKMTTNMPLTYQLYENYDTNNSIIATDTTIQDSFGTYFKIITVNQETFNYTENEKNIYTLYVYFPTSYNSIEYQNLIEYIEIDIDSKQIVN